MDTCVNGEEQEKNTTLEIRTQATAEKQITRRMSREAGPR